MPKGSAPEVETKVQRGVQAGSEGEESFGAIFSQYEKSHSRKGSDAGKGREAIVVAVTADSVLLDIGFKSEGILPLATFVDAGETVKAGDKFLVSVKGRNAEGYYELSRGKVQRPTDWASLEKAFKEKSTIVGTVIGAVKGGLSVDVGVRAFLPASRSGVRDAAQMEKLVGQEIRCRITELDVTEEDVVVDCRAVAEEEERATKERRYSAIKESETVHGTVRSLTDYGAFVDIGGVDALLHVSDISWQRINKPGDVLSVGQEIDAVVLKIDADKKRISIGMKQLQPHPWDAAAGKYTAGERVRGTVKRVMDFGAFVELEPGVEGLIHISEMSWTRKVRNPAEVVKPGETVEAVVLAVNIAERRISLGLKQTLGDPWATVGERFAVGSVIEGPVINLTKFGAFVQFAEGLEGMIHISDLSAEKRIQHPQEILKIGQVVKAQVLEIDAEKRRLRLGIKQLVPTSIEEYIAEHQEKDVVSGRVTEVAGQLACVELGEGIVGACRMQTQAPVEEKKPAIAKADLSSLSSMLQNRWKGGESGNESKLEALQAGQVRSFRIRKLDGEAKKIELELAK
ncbi:MAG TPA: 30S ribosomal protein S1 [Candidatus Sulfotelmatobacter sp.]